MLQQVDEDREHRVEVAFEHVDRHAGGVDVADRVDVRGARFEKVIELVAGLRLRAAGAPRLRENADQSCLRCGDVASSAANRGAAADQRQLVIFLKKNHHAVAEDDALRLHDGEGAERRRLNLAIVGGLREGAERQHRRGGDSQMFEHFHFEAPVAVVDAAGLLLSM